jgi:hypothetical protein
MGRLPLLGGPQDVSTRRRPKAGLTSLPTRTANRASTGCAYVTRGVGGLFDEPPSGAPRTVGDDQVEAVVVKTLESTPVNDPCQF